MKPAINCFHMTATFECACTGHRSQKQIHEYDDLSGIEIIYDDIPGSDITSFQSLPASKLSSMGCTRGTSDQMRTVESREQEANTNGLSGCDVKPETTTNMRMV